MSSGKPRLVTVACQGARAEKTTPYRCWEENCREHRRGSTATGTAMSRLRRRTQHANLWVTVLTRLESCFGLGCHVSGTKYSLSWSFQMMVPNFLRDGCLIDVIKNLVNICGNHLARSASFFFFSVRKTLCGWNRAECTRLYLVVVASFKTCIFF